MFNDTQQTVKPIYNDRYKAYIDIGSLMQVKRITIGTFCNMFDLHQATTCLLRLFNEWSSVLQTNVRI